MEEMCLASAWSSQELKGQLLGKHCSAFQTDSTVRVQSQCEQIITIVSNGKQEIIPAYSISLTCGILCPEVVLRPQI